MAQASDQDQILGTTIVTIPGHIGSGFEGSSTSGCRTEGPVPFNIVHSTAGEQEPTSFQAEDIEQICPHREVQTRKFGPTKNNVETERLSNETGPEGCVLLGTSSSETQEEPSISFSRCDLRVPVFTLRSIISTPSLHETGQASYCNPENIWHTSSDIFGRPTALPPGSNRAPDSLQDCNHPTHRPRVYHQTREVLTITHTSNHLSGSPAELDGHDNSCSSGETLPHTVGVQKDPDQGVVLHAGTFSIAGSNESDCPNWNLGSTIALSSPSTDVHCGYTQERSLHMIKAAPDSSNEGSILRTQVVVFGATKSNQPDGVEPFSNRHDNIDRRLQERLGGGSFLGQRTGGQWQKEEDARINVLELRSAHLAIQAFVNGTMHPRHIQVLMDNSTAVSYINKRGGTHSPTLIYLALEIWNFCISRQIWITARHVLE